MIWFGEKPMKILTGKDIRETNKATIERAGISSLDLVERAARGIARWIEESATPDARLLFCCGKGGNGSDGLASARILAESGRECAVFIAAAIGEFTADASANLSRLLKGVEVYDITVEHPDIEPDAVIIDALLGVGVTGPVREPIRGVIEWLNSMYNHVIYIDMPSRMGTECGSSETGIRPDLDPGAKPEFASEPESEP